MRYYKIFSDDNIDRIVRSNLKLSVQQIFTLGSAMWGFYLGKLCHDLPVRSNLKGVSDSDAEVFIDWLAKPVESIRDDIAKMVSLDETFNYSINPLRMSPLVIISDNPKMVCCPLPPLLAWKFTGGLYFDIVNDSRTSNSLGDSFQKYVGEVLDVVNTNDRYSVIPEGDYKKGQNRTIDWQVEDKGGVLFVECKCKRVLLSAKVELYQDKGTLESELGIMSEHLVQVYKTLEDYIGGLYEDRQYDGKKKIFPLVVTLENWRIFGKNAERLNVLLLERFEKEGLDKNLLMKYPYKTCELS